ncbi:MAG: HAD-IA family hydrolase [Nanoarchaeota archaeon]
MIKAIIFDFAGVLSNTGSLHLTIVDYAKKHGKDPETAYQVLQENWKKAKINQISSETFWKNLAQHLQAAPNELREHCMNYFGFRDETLELAKKLKTHYKLGLLSNQIEDWLEEVIKKHHLNEVFDVIVTSYNSRIAKPDPAIFKEMVKKLDTNPEECIYIYIYILTTKRKISLQPNILE